ncbi:WbqC family protein [Roseovarius sp. SCSIO 43702]|uniref:WbqC family protein n=1 Tax=Roseovarius sp. SCSIO 43702 TaxID=2823043 RepID=UPI001C72EF41|nr:WbqC family protein [Roseovarius sp. SCSIO 43702]QYX55682.1 WbqC family protein [Roseovarius sp. SCSIO 43702]
MSRVVISQPMYFPWAGFMAQMALADVMIWLDDAQFSKGSFTNRVQVKTQSGSKWMSVPLQNKGNRTRIRDLKLADPSIVERHRSLLWASLNSGEQYAEARKVFDQAWQQPDLVDVLISSAEELSTAIGLPPRTSLRSSDLNVCGRGSERVMKLVQAVGGQSYITGHGARNYLDHERFEDAGIAVEYMKYQTLPWPQAHGAFTPYVTALDLVAQVPRAERSAHLAPATENWKTFVDA